ncbi:MAG: hypothetical protein KJZ54_06115 [Phycisphaerales bacterium]|nr:hypothetical protein [Phycisphaerales bacterium]
MSRHTAASAVEDVFITPRIVDATAFEHFAGRLRSAVAEADAQRARLDAVAGAARPLVATLERAGAEVASRVESARAAASALAERLAALDRAAARIGDLERRAATLERTAAELQSRAIAAVEAAQRRLADIERTVAALSPPAPPAPPAPACVPPASARSSRRRSPSTNITREPKPRKRPTTRKADSSAQPPPAPAPPSPPLRRVDRPHHASRAAEAGTPDE